MEHEASDLAMKVYERFISRVSAKALQYADGAYRPVTTKAQSPTGEVFDTPIPFGMQDLLDHLSGQRTYGHYLLDETSYCKYFAFDIDLNTGDCEQRGECCESGHGTWFQEADWTLLPPELDDSRVWEWYVGNSVAYPARPREQWTDRSHPGRIWWKRQMMELGTMLASRIRMSLGIPALIAYTGSKGIHVYGFTGYMNAVEVREAAHIVLESFGRFQPIAGKNFYADTARELFTDSYGDNFTIEVFPKQDSVKPGQYGNLMRLPFGVNLKNPQDPTFLVDERSTVGHLRPLPDPLRALTTLDPFDQPEPVTT